MLLRGWMYLKNVISTLRRRIASWERSMSVAHRQRSAGAEALAHDLQGFSQYVDAEPRRRQGAFLWSGRYSNVSIPQAIYVLIFV